MALLTKGRLPVQLPLLAGCVQKSQPRTLAVELGSNLRTNADFQENMAPSKLLRTIGVSQNAP